MNMIKLTWRFNSRQMLDKNLSLDEAQHSSCIPCSLYIGLWHSVMVWFPNRELKCPMAPQWPRKSTVEYFKFVREPEQYLLNTTWTTIWWQFRVSILVPNSFLWCHYFVNLGFQYLPWYKASTMWISMYKSYAASSGMLFILTLKNKDIKELSGFVCFSFVLFCKIILLHQSIIHHLPFSVAQL